MREKKEVKKQMVKRKKWVASSAHYSKKDAQGIVKKLKKVPKLSVMKNKPKYKIKKETYRGKATGRWTIYRDAKSTKILRRINK